MSYQSGPAPLFHSDRPLDYWLSPELSAITPANARSRLREIAGARGAYMGAWAAGTGIGAVLVLLGVVLAVRLGTFATIAALSLPGAAVAVLCGVFYVRVRDRLPRTSRALVNRGPGSLRGALSFIAFVLVVFAGLFAFTAKPSTWQDPGTLLTLATVLAFMIFLLVAAILVPATIMGRSRESLRRKAANDPHFRALLEQDLATWRDPVGNAGYGPL
ncbi:hypothetical protein [Paenarthrobacter nicotinovorans]|uniref:hypothetical protein n=1 Tax=Paenarthrobacter nicotinovorans TaxID=29320 RepID=UPI0009A6A1A8|nr:hypothetical protein [Paenarthrobacter nicotinovorans]MDI2021664.1 hypothetical protein [Paenarthrobacter nicotinovorans]SKB34729.1 hypothetical protein SAMN05660916_00382 [Arthrobacter sp. 31Cvi3.1E]